MELCTLLSAFNFSMVRFERRRGMFVFGLIVSYVELRWDHFVLCAVICFVLILTPNGDAVLSIGALRASCGE